MTTILVIEDEQPLLEEIGDTLQFEGYEVCTAQNGLAGVRQAQSNTPDLIVCDISMPELDGYGVLLELRKNPATVTVPFVFLTARADKSFMRHGMELGADDYITKPFTHNELLAAVRSRLQRHSALSDRYGQELEQMKSSLARMVVHELRTPLVSVQLAKDIIERQLGRLSPASTKELMDAMGLGINRLNHVVEQMVYLTQIETGLLNRNDILENGIITPIEQILTSSFTMARRFAYRNREGAIQIGEQGEALVVAYTQALKHALAELIANALDFTPERQSVEINHGQRDGQVWIQIIDHGRGIAPQDQSKLFQRFVQIGRETQEQQGMGLGLFVAQQIIAAHGGSLELNSVPNGGTMVTVKLPLAGHE